MEFTVAGSGSDQRPYRNRPGTAVLVPRDRSTSSRYFRAESGHFRRRWLTESCGRL